MMPPRDADTQRKRLYVMSVASARAAADVCAANPAFFVRGAAPRGAGVRRAAETLGPEARSWFERHECLVSAVYGTEFAISPAQDRPGLVRVGADLDGAVYYLREGRDEILRNEFDDSLHELAQSICHAVLQVVWEEHGVLPGADDESLSAVGSDATRETGRTRR